jgi:nitronate monooxygenase
VMGTRFLAASEALIPKGYQDAVVGVKSGASGTVRTVLFDHLRGPNIWPAGYDGRAIINQTYVDAEGGMHLDVNSKLYAEALQGALPQYPESGQVPVGSGRLTMWAGSGVGLVNQVLPAAEIVKQTRKEVSESLEKIRTRCLAS